VQLFGRAPEGAEPGHLGEVFELLDPHTHQLFMVFRSD
jgi:hypothetical protein